MTVESGDNKDRDTDPSHDKRLSVVLSNKPSSKKTNSPLYLPIKGYEPVFGVREPKERTLMSRNVNSPPKEVKKKEIIMCIANREEFVSLNVSFTSPFVSLRVFTWECSLSLVRKFPKKVLQWDLPFRVDDRS